MSDIEFTPRAQRDIDDIENYIARDSIQAAIRLIDRLFETFESLSELPGQGIRCEDLAPGLLRFPSDNYVIYYLRTDSGILIVRVLHGARRVSRRLFRPSSSS